MNIPTVSPVVTVGEIAPDSDQRPPGSERAVRIIRRVDLSDVVLGSNETGRMINRDVLLQIIRSCQPVSRADLARLSGLQRSTVSEIVEQLINEDWIRERLNRGPWRGRRPVMLTLNDDLVALAVDIHPNHAVVALVDFNGRLLSLSNLPMGSNPEKSIRSIVNCMKQLRDNHRGKTLQGVGISLPGRVNTKTGRLVFAPNLHWNDCGLKEIVEREMGVICEQENAANSSLLSELSFGRIDGVHNAVLLTVSEGIGTGILANGKLITGHCGTAGEFGHIQIDPSGPPCGCGQVGCWETLASNKAAQRYYAEVVSTAKDPTYRELLQLADEGDGNAADALAKQAHYLSRGLRIIALALSPEVALVAGDLTLSWGRFASVIEDQLRICPLPGAPPRLQRVDDGDLARLRGAAALLLNSRSLFLSRKPGSVHGTIGLTVQYPS